MEGARRNLSIGLPSLRICQTITDEQAVKERWNPRKGRTGIGNSELYTCKAHCPRKGFRNVRFLYRIGADKRVTYNLPQYKSDSTALQEMR